MVETPLDDTVELVDDQIVEPKQEATKATAGTTSETDLKPSSTPVDPEQTEELDILSLPSFSEPVKIVEEDLLFDLNISVSITRFLYNPFQAIQNQLNLHFHEFLPGPSDLCNLLSFQMRKMKALPFADPC